MRWLDTATPHKEQPSIVGCACGRRNSISNSQPRRMDEIPVKDDRKSCEIRRDPAFAWRGKISDGDDAGASPRLQPDVYGMRPDTRIQIHDQRNYDGGAVLDGVG